MRSTDAQPRTTNGGFQLAVFNWWFSTGGFQLAVFKLDLQTSSLQASNFPDGLGGMFKLPLLAMQ
jgi:hypothetical protein